MRGGRVAKDRTNTRKGRLTYMAMMPRDLWRGKCAEWAVICDCGNLSIIEIRNHAQSCGCLHRERSAEVGARSFIHGHTSRAFKNGSSPTRNSWNAMITRCTRPNYDRFEDWGGRGIRVCERWMTFTNFLEDMGERPEGKTLDRIDNEGDYCSENCRWATPAEQAVNRRPRRRSKFATPI